eukprot:SAG31_NODE_7629_length_1636_cov_1.079375_1_plen_167_part_00
MLQAVVSARHRNSHARRKLVTHLHSPLIAHEYVSCITRIDLVVYNRFRRKQSHQCTFRILPRLLRQRIVCQHPKRIEHRRVSLQHVSSRIMQCELHEALRCILLNCSLDLIALVLAHVIWIEEQRFQEQLVEYVALEQQLLVGICRMRDRSALKHGSSQHDRQGRT